MREGWSSAPVGQGLDPHAPSGDDRLHFLGGPVRKCQAPGSAWKSRAYWRSTSGVSRPGSRVIETNATDWPQSFASWSVFWMRDHCLGRPRADAGARRVDERHEHDLALQGRQVEGLAMLVDQHGPRRGTDIGQRAGAGIGARDHGNKEQRDQHG